MTHRERMLSAMRGEMVDVIPFVPRLDLWWLAKATSGSIPEKYQGMMPDDISRAEGWPCYHMVPNFADITGENDILHRAIGLFNFRQSEYGWKFSSDVNVEVKNENGQQIVEYHTPLGMVRTVGGLTEEAKRAGSSLGWVQEHAIKNENDYRVLAHIFANITVFAQPESAGKYRESVGDDGVVAAGGPSLGGSPMHLIQKELIDATRFFFEYKDNYLQMAELAEAIGIYYQKVLDVLAESEAEVILWGANYDDMLTYGPYFEQEILPWLRKAAEVLGARGKIVATHTDGENEGLMEVIPQTGAHVAESVTPYPMTKVGIEEYYARWRPHMTIMGGIPESVLLEDTASDEDFEAFLDHLFASIAPGDRIILGTADSTPPEAKFERLHRIAERVEKEGLLPLTAGSFNPVSDTLEKDGTPEAKPAAEGEEPLLTNIADLVKAGDQDALTQAALDMVSQKTDARTILKRGMIPAMEDIGRQFTTGTVFIPEVLLSARAMNRAMEALEPYFKADAGLGNQKVLIGTVAGDMHDIGKNMVAIMLRGVGFEVRDIGINVAAEEFVRQVEDFSPDLLGLSALLTTTMPEMENVLHVLQERGLRENMKVMVGGAPVNARFAERIGADGYAADAGEAVAVARRLVAGE